MGSKHLFARPLLSSKGEYYTNPYLAYNKPSNNKNINKSWK